jgi:hypothetical protein
MLKILHRLLSALRPSTREASSLTDEEREQIEAAAAQGMRRTFLPRAGRSTGQRFTKVD